MANLTTEKIKDIISTTTFRQSSVTFIGVFINGVLGMVFYILSARLLLPDAYGIMVVALAAMTLVSDIADLGTNTGLVRFVGKYIHKDKQKAYRFLKLSLMVKLGIGVSIGAGGFLLSGWIASTIFNKPQLSGALHYAFAGVLFTLLFTFTSASLQSLQKFKQWTTLQILLNFLRVSLVLLLLIFGVLTLENTLISYILMPLIGFMLAMALFIPRKFLSVTKPGSVSREFFKYNKWVALFTLVAAISARLDTFLSARLLSTAEVGFYGVATQLTSVIPQVVGALGVVIAPKMASMTSQFELSLYIRKVFLLVVGIAIVAFVGGCLISFLIPTLYGEQYSASVPIFLILLGAMLLFLIAVPFHTAIFYYFARPDIFFWLGLVNLGIISVLGWQLITQFGMIGAALSVLVGQAVNLAFPLWWVKRKI